MTHYSRWRKHGDPNINLNPRRPDRMPHPELVRYFLEQATRDGDCLLPPLTKGFGGHTWTRVGRRTVSLHRLVLEVTIGRELRPEEFALRRCRQPACINPRHLYVGTDADRDKGGRPSLLTAEEQPRVRELFAAGDRSKLSLAKQFGVSPRTIRRALEGS